jgi:hypothetical protein
MPKPIITDREILEAALVGLQHSLATVDEKMKELRRQAGGKAARHSVAVASAGATPPRRVVSAAARKRMGAAQKKRWAAFRKAQTK